MENSLKFSNKETSIKKIGQICDFNPKSKMPASSGREYGKYRFFKSDTSEDVFYCNEYITDGNTIIINDGGVFNVKYFEGKAGYSDHCIVFHTKKDFIEKYIYYILTSKASYINQYGFIGGTLKNIDRTWFNDYQVNIHQYDDQLLISKFLSNIDSLIEEKKNGLEKTKQYKEAMLYKMFPKEGSKVPEIRFKGFEGEWEKKTIDDIALVEGGFAFNAMKMSKKKTNYQILKMGNIYKSKLDLKRTEDFWNKPSKEELKYRLLKNDIVITLTGTVNKTDYGYSYIFGKDTKLLLNQRLARLKAKNGYDSTFVSYLIKDGIFLKQFFELGAGGTGNQSNVGVQKLRYITVLVPTYNEQKKIGNILKNINDLELELEEEIAILENYKATLLEKMFA